MSKIKVGDKVRVIGEENYHGFEIGEVVICKSETVTREGHLLFENNNRLRQYLASVDYEKIEDNKPVIPTNFKVGDKVRLIEKECKGEYYKLKEGLLEEPEILTISYVRNGYDGEVIGVAENHFTYHPSWLEKVEVPKSTKHHLLITGVHFGNPKEYCWNCGEDLFNEISIGNIVEVETKNGKQFVQVVGKSEVKNKPTEIHREVVALVNVEYY